MMASAIKELIPRKNYAFFLAGIQPSAEIVGWVALSFKNGRKLKRRTGTDAKEDWNGRKLIRTV